MMQNILYCTCFFLVATHADTIDEDAPTDEQTVSLSHSSDRHRRSSEIPGMIVVIIIFIVAAMAVLLYREMDEGSRRSKFSQLMLDLNSIYHRNKDYKSQSNARSKSNTEYATNTQRKQRKPRKPIDRKILEILDGKRKLEGMDEEERKEAMISKDMRMQLDLARLIRHSKEQSKTTDVSDIPFANRYDIESLKRKRRDRQREEERKEMELQYKYIQDPSEKEQQKTKKRKIKFVFDDETPVMNLDERSEDEIDVHVDTR